jgi:GT2 family glycosyltransferase
VHNSKSADSHLTLAAAIPTWKRSRQLRNLLYSLHRQVRLPDEVIIACRDNDDEALSVVKNWAKSSPLASRRKVVKVYEEGHLPPLVALLQVCESDILCQIDDDAIPRDDWLMRLENDFRDPRIGGIGGKVINHGKDDNRFILNRAEIMTPRKLSWFGRSGRCGPARQTNSSLLEADCFLGGNMAVRSKALSGCIDLKLNGGSATLYEIDLGLNLRRKGYQLFYDPEVLVDHYPAPRRNGVQRGWNPQECYWYAHNLTYICLKHLPWYGRLAFLSYFFIGGQWGCPAPLTYLFGLVNGRYSSLKQQFLPSLRGRLAGIRSHMDLKIP